MSYRKVCDRCLGVFPNSSEDHFRNSGWSEWRLPNRETFHFCDKCTRIIRLIFRIPLQKLRDGVQDLQQNTPHDPLSVFKREGGTQ